MSRCIYPNGTEAVFFWYLTLGCAKKRCFCLPLVPASFSSAANGSKVKTSFPLGTIATLRAAGYR